MRPKAIDVKVLNNYELEIKFDNNERKIFDVKPYFKFKIFNDLKNYEEFKKVQISGLSIEWKNGADICPDELYNNSRQSIVDIFIRIIIVKNGGAMQGLIIENIANLYKIKVKNKIYEANARGKFKKEEITPVVGDKVEIQILDEENKKAVIEEIQERTTYIKRPKMSNITQLVLVVSSKNPKPDLLLLDKQLAFAEFLGIKAIIVLNKTDLDKKKEFEKIKEVYQNIGYTVIETIAKDLEDIPEKSEIRSIGIHNLEKNLKGNINAFSGNSGVGKSTLINAIFKDTITQEGEISQRNKKGKNTTTSTKLYEIDENTYIADTPGFSTFDISEIEYRELDKYFKEFKPLLDDCEFVGCTHIKEENCGIKQALQQGKIDNGRYERFCKIYEELKEKDKYKY